MINVVKALNYAAMGATGGSPSSKARQIDHRLNVLADSAKRKDGYREDAFARYLTGVLYESTGDMNNAFIAYRRPMTFMEATKGWSRTPMPPMLRADLLRTAEALHLTTEFEEYRHQFPETRWVSRSDQPNLAQVVVISYNAARRARKRRFSISRSAWSALQLVLLNRGSCMRRIDRSVVRRTVCCTVSTAVSCGVACPSWMPQKTQVAQSQ